MAKIPQNLRREWYAKLKTSGFIDIEDEHQNLKQPNTRTKAFETRDSTAEFYQLLDAYMIATKELTRLERRILEMYSAGTKLDEIAWDVYRSRAYVKSIIYRHRDIILHKK